MIPQTGVKRHPLSTPIYVRGRSHPIGFVAGGVFYKQLRAHHFLTTPPAIAFDRSTLVDAERAGATSIHITNSDTGATYEATIADVWRHGFDVKRGYGAQIALALPKWTINGQAPAPTFNSNAEIQAAQPSLFGEG